LPLQEVGITGCLTLRKCLNTYKHEYISTLQNSFNNKISEVGIDVPFENIIQLRVARD
jgi:hypothetical protein